MANKKINTKKLCYSGIFTAFIVICSWITVPYIVPFTLQLLAVFVACYLLDVYALLSYLCYVLLGIMGVPVFSGFNSGVSVILGPTGGFLIGIFFIIAITIFSNRISTKFHVRFCFSVIGLLFCYIVGVFWYVFIYLKGGFNLIVPSLTVCVFPFVIFDILKILLACFLSKKIAKIGL